MNHNCRSKIKLLHLTVLLVVSFSIVSLNTAGDPPAPSTTKAEVTNPFIEALQNNKATAAMLIDAIGSTDDVKRRQAATAIVALRTHYIQVCQTATLKGYAGELTTASLWCNLDVLTSLRPSSPEVLSSAMRNINFSWYPPITSSGDDYYAYRATGLLVEGSFATLPQLSDLIATSPLPSEDKPLDGNRMAIPIALSILGPVTSTWLKDQADACSNIQKKKALDKAAAYSQHQTDVASKTGGDAPVLRRFGAAQELDNDAVLPTPLEKVDLKSFYIAWDAADAIAERKPANNMLMYPSPRSTHAATQVEWTMQVLEYHIAGRLRVEPDPNSTITPYPRQAHADAMRVLGCLRCKFVPGVMWSHLRAITHDHPIDTDQSDEVQACFRALQQIDIPSVHFLLTRVALQQLPEQQQAATFALGKVAGRYTPYYLWNAVLQRQHWIAATSDADEKQSYEKELERLQAMLKLGKEKKWFTGDYYGAHDPHAYDLVFDDAPAPAKTPQP